MGNNDKYFWNLRKIFVSDQIKLIILDVLLTAIKELPGSGEDVMVHELTPLHHHVGVDLALRLVLVALPVEKYDSYWK